MSDEHQPGQKDKFRLLLEAKTKGLRQALDDDDIRVSPTSRPAPRANWDYVQADADPGDPVVYCNADPTDPVHHFWPNPYLFVEGARDDAGRE